MSSAGVHANVRNDEKNTEGLFTGLKFWFSNTVPQKSRFIEDVRANGGEVFPLEKQADICLYDHARKNPPPGTYSYRYVEYSARNGELEDLEAHRIGGLDSRAARPVGSVTLASKGSRQTFTEADDQMLWDWIQPIQGMRGSAGNLVYQQLEAANPRHTFQSWRDRWLKYVQYQRRDVMSREGQRQHNAAPVVEQPATIGTTPRATRASVDSASESPRIVVEVPLKESPRRKRGRPRKIQREELNDDTVEVDSPATPKQPGTPTGFTRKEDMKRVHSEKTPSTEAKTKDGSWEFSDEDRDLLLKAVEVILQVPENEAGPAWERMAEVYEGHTAQQWRNYFEEVVVPCYRKQPKGSPQPTTKTVDTGRLGRRVRAYSEVQLIRPRQVQRLVADTDTEEVRQTGNEDSEATATQAQPPQRSLSFQPESPSDWKTENDSHRPGPNESRKRSSAKSNSQESAVTSRAAKRSKPSQIEDTVPEIPSTPEDTQESETLEDLPGTPTPRARKRPYQESDRSLSPLVVPSDGTVEEDTLPSTGGQELEVNETIDPETHTSPISVRLVSDHDPAVPSSSSAPDRIADNESAGSPTPEFETAPDFSQIHEDVSEQEEQQEFETAAAEQTARKATMPDTQALFAGPTQNRECSFDLRLPEPEGGWDAVEEDLGNGNAEAEAIDVPASPISSTASTLELDLDAWVALRVAEGRDMDLLLTAAAATNMHKKLADTVYESLDSAKRIPKDTKGVWTEEDDKVLMGTDAREIKRVEDKHGQRSVDERWECLGVWNG